MRKQYLSAPLPFQGQKRMFVREYINVLQQFPDGTTFVDLFGGSGLLSHIAKCQKPHSTVVYNDFDGYRQRLEALPVTNALLAELRQIVDVPRHKPILGETKERVLSCIRKYLHDYGYIDYITLSSSIMFSMKYATEFSDLEKETLYNNIRTTDYEPCADYLDGLTITSCDYREVFKQYKDVPGVVFLVDPPYLSTDSAGNTVYNRYKYSNGSWLFEYALNNSSFTAAQWAAINSAITSGDVEKLAALPTKAQLDALFAAKQDTLTFDNLPMQNSNNPVKSGGVFTALESKAEKVVVEYFEFPQDPVGAATLNTNTIAEVDNVNVMRFILGDPISDIKNEYCIKFNVKTTIPTLSLPSEIIWAEELALEANTHYVLLISYENGGLYGDWKAYPLT